MLILTLTIDFYLHWIDGSHDEQKVNVKHKEPQIENLFEFLGLQSFDGKFLPKKSFYEFFYKNDLNDFINLRQEIEKVIDKTIKSEIEEILSTCIAIAYLEIIMFEKFKDECEMCYEKAEKVLKKMIGGEERKKVIVEKSKEWINNWINSNNEAWIKKIFFSVSQFYSYSYTIQYVSIVTNMYAFLSFLLFLFMYWLKKYFFSQIFLFCKLNIKILKL